MTSTFLQRMQDTAKQVNTAKQEEKIRKKKEQEPEILALALAKEFVPKIRALIERNSQQGKTEAEFNFQHEKFNELHKLRNNVQEYFLRMLNMLSQVDPDLQGLKFNVAVTASSRLTISFTVKFSWKVIDNCE